MKKLFSLLFITVLALTSVSAALSLTVTSPDDSVIYNSSKVSFNLAASSISDFFYAKSSSPFGAWTFLCSKTLTCVKDVASMEGTNTVRIKAVDSLSGETDISGAISFVVDSKKPIITKVLPLKGVTSGKFEIQFTEQNPDTAVLHYGNALSGYQTLNAVCTQVKDKNTCTATVSVTDGDLGYWFNATDKAGNSVESKLTFIKVDSTAPVINLFENSLSRNVLSLVFDITESNFDSVTYIDNADRVPRNKTICSSLQNGRCSAKISLSKGAHRINIFVSDKAGNVASNPAEIPILLTVV